MLQLSDFHFLVKLVAVLRLNPFQARRAFNYVRRMRRIRRIRMDEQQHATVQLPSKAEIMQTLRESDYWIQRWISQHERKLRKAPGWTLRRIAAVVYSRKTFELVFEPTLENMQREYFEALKDGDHTRASIAAIRGRWSFSCAVIAQLPVSVAKKLYVIWKTIQ